jgi:porphobilinogen synthase
MLRRNRILRKSSAIRSIVEETRLSVDDFIVPLFVSDETDSNEEISSIPGYYRISKNLLSKEIREIEALGLKSVLLFVKVQDKLKDNKGTEALNPNGLMQESIKIIKDTCPELLVMTDVALDPYSIYGHDGIVENHQILNDPTVEVLSAMSVSHAKAGADFVAPSDMMDGRIKSIRLALEESGFNNTGIMAYSAKYASCFYGPFRDALDSAPGFGDKKTYQMNSANRREAIDEILRDVEEGADIVMVKPALSYLDIIREARNAVNVPVSAYNVSGEYAMIKAAAEKGWLNEEQAIKEVLLSIKRAGADLIASYFSKTIAKIINE